MKTCFVERVQFSSVPWPIVPAGSPSHGGDVTVHVKDTNQPNLPTPFHSILVSIFMALSTVFYSIKFSRQLIVFSLCSSGLISVLSILSTRYFFMKVSFIPDIIPSG